MYKKPKGFNFVRGFCVFVGGLGIIGGLISLLMILSPSGKQTFQHVDQGFWETFWGILRNAGFWVGGQWIFKLRNYGRILIITCATLGLLEYFYDIFFILSASFNFTPVLISYTVIVIFIDGGILAYFCKKNVKNFILSH